MKFLVSFITFIEKVEKQKCIETLVYKVHPDKKFIQ